MLNLEVDWSNFWIDTFSFPFCSLLKPSSYALQLICQFSAKLIFLTLFFLLSIPRNIFRRIFPDCSPWNFNTTGIYIYYVSVLSLFVYLCFIHNKRKIVFCPKESIFTPLEVTSPPLRMHVLQSFTKEELLVFRDMQFFVIQKWLPNCRTLSLRGSCPTNISDISSNWGNKKCFLREEIMSF